MIYGTGPQGILRRGDDVAHVLDLPFPDLGSALTAGVSPAKLDAADTREKVDPRHGVLAPVAARTGNVWALGLAYQDHVNEAKSATSKQAPEFPPLFLKASSSITDPGAPIRLPAWAPDEVDYEGEIVIIVGRTGHDIPASAGWDHVFGLTAANDVSARDVQFGRFSGGTLDVVKAKSFDTFTPLGPWVVTPDEFPGRDDIALTTHVNGDLRQSSSTAALFWPITEIVSFVSRFTTLEPGDLILTGTPGGTGRAQGRFLRAGDEVRIDVPLVGSLTNHVVAPASASLGGMS